MYLLRAAPPLSTDPLFIALTTTSNAGATTLTHGTMPTHAALDKLYWVVAWEGPGVGYTMTTPSGWVLEAAVNHGTMYQGIWIFSKTAASSSETAPTTTLSGSINATGHMMTYRNVNRILATLLENPAPSPATVVTLGTISTTNPNDIVLRALLGAGNTGYGTGLNWATSLERIETAMPSTFGAGTAPFAVAERTLASPGATGTEAVSTSIGFAYFSAIALVLTAIPLPITAQKAKKSGAQTLTYSTLTAIINWTADPNYTGTNIVSHQLKVAVAATGQTVSAVLVCSSGSSFSYNAQLYKNGVAQGSMVTTCPSNGASPVISVTGQNTAVNDVWEVRAADPTGLGGAIQPVGTYIKIE